MTRTNLIQAQEYFPLSRVRSASEALDAEVLTDIYQTDCNIAIWKRALNSDLSRSLQQLASYAPNYKFEATVTASSVRDGLLKSLEGYDCAEALSADIATLVDMYCCLFDLNSAGLRLTMLNKAMCPRFHVDRVPCRLVTTYCGAASEWLQHDIVDRSKLGHGNMGLPDHESGIYRDPRDIRQLNNGDVALFKGELWQGNENAGLVHRSPQVAEGEVRLLLTLDFGD